MSTEHTHTVHLFASIGRGEEVHHIGDVEIDARLTGDDLAAAFVSAFEVLAAAAPVVVDDRSARR